jgi:S-formylglutathione hydrolase FrmB
VAQAAVWKAYDPTDIAAALKGAKLFVSYGNGELGPLDNGSPSDLDPNGSTEHELGHESQTFVQRLAALKIPVTVDAYGNGTHSYAYFGRELQRSLPLILKALGQ